MHTPGSAVHHHAFHAHHRAVHMHRAAHFHARRSADHGQAVYGGLLVSGLPAARTAPRAARRRTSGVVTFLRFVIQLVAVVVLVGVVLLVVRPTHPEWLAQLVHELDGLLRTLRSAVP
jgi:hypothetical protein